MILKFVHENSNVKSNCGNNLITFNFLKKRLECSRKLEKVMILMAFFCMTKRGCKVDFHVQSVAFDKLKPRSNDRNIVGCNERLPFEWNFR